MITARVGLLASHGLPRRGARAFSSSPAASKQRLVILGSGWAGYELLRSSALRRTYDVAVLSPNTYFSFTPLLASTAVGTLEFRCALEPVRRYGADVASYQAWCDGIDFQAKTLTCMPATPPTNRAHGSTALEDSRSSSTNESFPGSKPFKLSYDKLVIAVGAYSQTFNIPGVKEYAFFLKDVKDARRIRSRILETFEQAAQPTLTDIERLNLLNFVIVGGGPTGIEFAAELHDLIQSDLARHYPALAPLARVTIYDTAPRILGAFDSDLVQYAAEKFARQGITIKTAHHVTKVNEASIEVKEEGTVPFGLLVWSTGLAPNPLIASIKDLEQDPKTLSLKVNDHFQTRWKDGTVNEDVYCAGDASVLTSGPLPATAQVANQEAKHVVKSLLAAGRGRAMPAPFEFSNKGIMTYIGDYKALYDRSNAKEGPTPKSAGHGSWLLWRSAYWGQSMSMRNRLSMSFYWTLNWLFGRDITRF